MTDPRRRIPGVDRLLASQAAAPLLAAHPRARVSVHLKEAVERVRSRIARGEPPPDVEDPALYADLAREALDREALPSLRPVINATGVVLHTNLGRAPLASEALDAMARVGPGYTNLEMDLATGRRGSRYAHCADLITELTGAGQGLVVNNCAAALVLAVNTLAAGRGVAVSRGELVEVGGGFRIPDMLARAGARLVEVGSTNRTRLADYRRALDGQDAAMILKVHRSNFRISGFTEEAGLGELAGLAAEAGVPLVHDLGSGLLADPAALGLPDEPTPSQSLARGADLVVFSGDKLLGGPQAGLVAGADGPVTAMRSNPLCRAFRVDKATLAGLEATLRLYRDPNRAVSRIPILAMLAAPEEALEARARALAGRLSEGGAPATAAPGLSAVGGGTFPGVELATWTVRVQAPGGAADTLAAALRRHDPPVVGRREDDDLVLDLRTVAPDQDPVLEGALRHALSDVAAP